MTTPKPSERVRELLDEDDINNHEDIVFHVQILEEKADVLTGLLREALPWLHFASARLDAKIVPLAKATLEGLINSVEREVGK